MKQVALLLIATLIAVLMTVSVSVGRTQTTEQTATPLYNIVLAEDVVLRGGPGIEYPIVGSLQSGDFLFPVSRNEDTTWILVSYFRGTYGWVRRDLGFWVDDNLEALPSSLPTT